MKTILVTGCAGYIGGSFLYEALLKGNQVIGVDNFSNSNEERLMKIRQLFNESFYFHKLDLSYDQKSLEDLLSKHSIEVVVHFAGLKSVPESEIKKESYYKNNILGTKNLVNAMSNSGVDELVFSSSAAVYGNKKEQPVTEDSAPEPMSYYAETKLKCEELITDATKKSSLKSVILRYFNPLGAHNAGIFYEDIYASERNVLTNIMRVYLGIASEFFIYGYNFSTKDGTGVRDYIHIDDLVEGHFKAIEYLISIDNYDVFNLGTNRGVSVKQLVDTFNSISEKEINYKYLERRPFDIPVSLADANKSNKMLNWSAKKTIKEMCESYLRIYKK